MPALFIDGINEQFQAMFGDLLIETAETGPIISSEYQEQVRVIFSPKQDWEGE
jgi:hypothetical protein